MIAIGQSLQVDAAGGQCFEFYNSDVLSPIAQLMFNQISPDRHFPEHETMFMPHRIISCLICIIPTHALGMRTRISMDWTDKIVEADGFAWIR